MDVGTPSRPRYVLYYATTWTLYGLFSFVPVHSRLLAPSDYEVTHWAYGTRSIIKQVRCITTSRLATSPTTTTSYKNSDKEYVHQAMRLPLYRNPESSFRVTVLWPCKLEDPCYPEGSQHTTLTKPSPKRTEPQQNGF